MSTVDEIFKIKKLLDSGAITQEEFELLKQEAMAENSLLQDQSAEDEDLSDTAPVLKNWKTSIGATIGGIALSLFLFGTGSSTGFIDALFVASGTVISLEQYTVLSLAISFCLTFGARYYALIVYPSLFTTTPKIKSSKAISFFNGFLGYIVFGCIWNSNLTKQHKGISNKVFAVICVLVFIGNIIMSTIMLASFKPL